MCGVTFDNRNFGKEINMLNGFFDIDFRLEQLDKCGDPLTKLNEVVPWDDFHPKQNN